MPPSASRGASDGTASEPSKRRVTTPILLQMHATECGAACLGSILAYFGRWVPLTELRESCEVSRDGSSAASISRASRRYGLECKGLGVPAETLKKLPLPLILFWQYSHFVVLEGFDSRNFHLNDPAMGRRTVSAEEFTKSYSGIALQFNRGADFKPGGERPGLFRQLRALLAGSWGVLTGVTACGLMLTLLALLVPASLSVFVDDVLKNHGPWGGLVTALLGGGVLVYFLSLLKHRFLKRLAVRISVVGSNRSMSRLLRLPVEFFEHRLVGDLTDRVSSIDRIAKNLTEQFLVLIIDMAMSAVLLIAMLAYDVPLTLIVLLLALVHGVLAHFLNALRDVRSQAMRREQGLLLSVGMLMLSHADNLRMTGSDDRFFSRWTGQQARELRARQLYAELGSVNAALPGLIATLRGAAILGIGGSLVITGEMTLGTLVGFYILAEMFLAPVGRFLEFADKRHALAADLQRLDDVSKAAEDPIFSRRSPGSKSIPTFNGRLQLAGPARAAGRHFRLQQEPAALDQGLQPRHQARAAGRRGRSQRLREVDPGAAGFGYLSALVRRNPV